MKRKFRMWGFFLLPLSLILFFLTAAIGWGYAMVVIPFKRSQGSILWRWQHYWLRLAVSIDQLGNVLLQYLLNDLLLCSRSTNRFGHEDETISSVLGKNQKNNSLSGVGKFLSRFLDLLDPNHVLNSIEHPQD
ncbi:MAG: hypothetical protein ISP66_03085 [Flavobacteriaceae bacterium]|nr:hypothetical protein [Flavobacteriaceae bacterium]